MAGLGRRFADTGVSTLKPFIIFNEKHMIEHVLSGVPTHLFCTSVILQSETYFEYKKQIEFLTEKFDLELISIPSLKRGPVCTILESKDNLSSTGAVLFLDCDGLYGDEIIKQFTEKALSGNCDAAIITTKSNLNDFSYVVVDNQVIVEEIKEKIRISENAVTGAYFFKDVNQFIRVAEGYLHEVLDNNNEYYLSEVIHKFVSLGLEVMTFHVDSADYSSVGTPKQLEDYLARQ